jgi:arylformamidase
MKTMPRPWHGLAAALLGLLALNPTQAQPQPAARNASASASAPAATPATAPTAPAAKVLRNVPYGKDARQKFDVYLPAQPTGPVLFLVHGGGWTQGDKAAPDLVRSKVAHWGLKGYVIVSTNYPLMPKARPLEQAAQVALAMASAQKMAKGWGADPARFVLMGDESGSHLAALITVVPSIAEKAGLQRWRGTVALDPAYMAPEEVMKAPHDKALDKILGTTPAEWEALSPRHLLADGPPPPPLMMWCSKQRANSCELALHYERKAAKFKHQIVIWERFEPPADVSRLLGVPGKGVEQFDAWLGSVIQP